MLYKTRGIVLKTTPYAGTSVVVQVFTEEFGLQSYLINGVKRPKAKIRMNMLQPLHLLDLVVYHKDNGSIQRVSEIRPNPVLLSIPFDVRKNALVLFLNEVLYKSLRSQDADEQLFEYVFSAIELLDRLETGLANFHLLFLLHLTRFLGFYPDRTFEDRYAYFDLHSGSFIQHPAVHQFVIHPPESEAFKQLLRTNFKHLNALKIAADHRRILLQKLIDYYRLHLDNFGEVQSLQILEELFQ